MSDSLIPASHADILETTALAHVATIGANGAPQNNPVWFGWDGTHLMFSQRTDRQKLRNVRARPQVAVSIVDPADPYRYLEIRGTVTDIVDDPDKAFINSMAQKYLDVPINPWEQPGEQRVVVKIRPDSTTSMG